MTLADRLRERAALLEDAVDMYDKELAFRTMRVVLLHDAKLLREAADALEAKEAK